MSVGPPAHQEDVGEHFCRVCGAEVPGILVSCRACATFFRRSAKSSHRLKCRASTYDCDVLKDASTNCRCCRFQKCVDVGMSLEEEDEDAMQHSADPCHSACMYIDPLEIAPDRLPEVTVDKFVFKHDTDAAMQKVMKILDQPHRRTLRRTPMQALLHAYQNMIPGGKPDKVRVEKTIDFRVYAYFMNLQLERIAKWAMECREFADLPLQDKRKMFEHFWRYIYVNERCKRGTEFFEVDTPPHVCLNTDATAVDIRDFDYVLPGVNAETLTAVNAPFKPFYLFTYNNFIFPLRQMNLTTFELVYLCLFSMWSVRKLSDLSPRTVEIAEKVLDEASNELHDYYFEELRIRNYVLRLGKLFRLYAGLELVQNYAPAEKSANE